VKPVPVNVMLLATILVSVNAVIRMDPAWNAPWIALLPWLLPVTTVTNNPYGRWRPASPAFPAG
jgi:hypothetical protein